MKVLLKFKRLIMKEHRLKTVCSLHGLFAMMLDLTFSIRPGTFPGFL